MALFDGGLQEFHDILGLLAVREGLGSAVDALERRRV